MPDQAANPVSETADHAQLGASPSEEDRARVTAGPGAPAESHVVHDPYQGVRVDHGEHIEGRLPPEEASAAGEALASGHADARTLADDPAPPPQSMRVLSEQASVWEATGESEA